MDCHWSRPPLTLNFSINQKLARSPRSGRIWDILPLGPASLAKYAVRAEDYTDDFVLNPMWASVTTLLITLQTYPPETTLNPFIQSLILHPDTTESGGTTTALAPSLSRLVEIGIYLPSWLTSQHREDKVPILESFAASPNFDNFILMLRSRPSVRKVELCFELEEILSIEQRDILDRTVEQVVWMDFGIRPVNE